jgi:chromosomal replication initiation ATPase DnaA
MPKLNTTLPDWEDVLNKLRTALREDTVQMWFSPAKWHRVKNGIVAVTVPNEFCEVWIRDNYNEVLLAAIQAIVPSIRKITFRVESANKANRPKIFVSYSHHDMALLERMLVHLRPLEREMSIETWTDKKISFGSDWREELRNAIKDADIAILLVSADFLASEFIMTEELPSLLQRAKSKGTRILPLICKPCRFLRTPQLARFQAVNDPERPLLAMEETAREAIFNEVAEIVEDACKGHSVN